MNVLWTHNLAFGRNYIPGGPTAYMWSKGEGKFRKPPAVIDLASACDTSMEGVMSDDTGTAQLMVALDMICEVFAKDQIKAVLMGRKPLTVVEETDHYGHAMFHMTAYYEHVSFILRAKFGEDIPIIAHPAPPVPEGLAQSIYRYLPILRYTQALAVPYNQCAALNADPQATFTEKVKLFGLDRRREDPDIRDVANLNFLGIEF